MASAGKPRGIVINLSFLRAARWFGPDRAVNYAKVVAIAYVPILLWIYKGAIGSVGCDFMAFWSAAKLTLQGNPAGAYDAATQSAFQGALGRPYFFPFISPPPFLAVAAPFGLLPYPVALPVWVVTTFTAYLVAARRLAPKGLWPIAAYSACLVNAMYGQVGFLTAALLIGAITLLEKRPFVAGLLFGALVIKPHMGVLIPVALIAGRQWRAFGGAALSFLALAIGGYLLFGPAATRAFLETTSLSASLLTDTGGSVKMLFSVLPKTPSAFAVVKILSGSQAAAAGAQVILLAALCIVIWRVWARPGDLMAKGAALAAATVLTSPYLLNYDLVLLILPICWLAQQGLRHGFWPWERALLAMIYWMPFVSLAATALVGFDLAFFSSLLLLWMVWRRWSLGAPPAEVPARATVIP